MAKVIAKQTLLGSYGLAKEGDVIEVSDKIAALLKEKDLVKDADESAPVTTESKNKEPEKEKDKKPEKEKASVTITDNTNKEKKEILKP